MLGADALLNATRSRRDGRGGNCRNVRQLNYYKSPTMPVSLRGLYLLMDNNSVRSRC